MREIMFMYMYRSICLLSARWLLEDRMCVCSQRESCFKKVCICFQSVRWLLDEGQ